MKHVRLTQIDGRLPNLALMKLANWHKCQGDAVYLTRALDRDMLEPIYDVIYGSAIFAKSAARVDRLMRSYPNAIVGGTWNPAQPRTVEEIVGRPTWEHYDYSIYPDFPASIGFTQRGCRLKCGFCVVPKKEGKPRSVNTIADIWRGREHPRHLHLLDNDFFGQPEDQWRARIDEICDGGFKVSLTQGINIRMVDDQAAAALACIQYRDPRFEKRRLYTAWDSLGDEARFFAGVDRLEAHGIPPSHLMVYMLTGYDRRETWARIFHRFDKMVARGIQPYPMIYGDPDRTLEQGGHNAPLERHTLRQFQRWVLRRIHGAVPFAEYSRTAIAERRYRGDQLELIEVD